MRVAQRVWLFFFWSFFLILGVTENLRSALLPLIKVDLSLSDQGLSGLLMIGALASVVFQLLGGRLIDRLGQQTLYHVALLACVVSLSLAPTVSGLSSGLLFFFSLHMGFTLYSLLTNSLIPTMGAQASKLLTLSHGCYGLGAALSSLVAERLLSWTGGWQGTYQALAVPYLLLWLLLSYLSPAHRQLPSLKTEESPRLATLLKRPELWLFSGLFGFVITAEVASSSWLVRYLSEVAELSRAEAGYFLTGFYALFTLTRFVASSLPARLGERRVMKWGLSGAGLCITLAMLEPSLSGYPLALSGAFFALVFPSVLMSLSLRYPEHRAHVLGLVISGALGVFMLMNALIGAFCEHISVRFSYLIMLSCVGLALLLQRRVLRAS